MHSRFVHSCWTLREIICGGISPVIWGARAVTIIPLRVSRRYLFKWVRWVRWVVPDKYCALKKIWLSLALMVPMALTVGSPCWGVLAGDAGTVIASPVASSTDQYDGFDAKYHQAIKLYDGGDYRGAVASLEEVIFGLWNEADQFRNQRGDGEESQLELGYHQGRRLEVGGHHRLDRSFFYNLGNMYYRMGSSGWALASYLEALARASARHSAEGLSEEDLWANIELILTREVSSTIFPPELRPRQSSVWLWSDRTVSSIWPWFIHDVRSWWYVLLVAMLVSGGVWGSRRGRYRAVGRISLAGGAVLSLIFWLSRAVYHDPGDQRRYGRDVVGYEYGVICCHKTVVYSTPGVSRVELYKLSAPAVVRFDPRVGLATFYASEVSSQGADVSSPELNPETILGLNHQAQHSSGGALGAIKIEFILAEADRTPVLSISSEEVPWRSGWVEAGQVLSWPLRLGSQVPQ